ncbi:endospore germination permease [Anaerobacillus sp. MEB173]|uniref:GerAB/ArcD/ProY family transporter n=1 Tax=Anaerobacillus sp. MEB173 TaxID=3383345 RepID=UPI003F90CBC4
MTRISNIQLFILILVFEIGSTTLFAIGIGANQDAWIVVVFKTLIGLCLLLFYTQFPKIYPYQNFAEILYNILGKKLALPLLFLFSLYFFNQTTYNFFEFGFLIKMTSLEKTPLLVILYVFIIVMAYILILGFEVLARTAEIFLPYFLLFLIMIYVLTLFSGLFDISALQPVLGNGLKPVLAEAIVEVGFPFGEMVVFLMFWHYIENQKLLRKTSLFAVALSGLLLMISLIVMLSMLGPELTANSEIPLLEVILAINIAEIITNLDSIAVFIMFIGGFYKTALHFYGFSIVISWLFNLKNPKWIMIIFGILLPIVSVIRFPSINYHRWIGSSNSTYIIPLFMFIPIVLLIIIYIKKKMEGDVS